jgi:hypothetical protein
MRNGLHGGARRLITVTIATGVLVPAAFATAASGASAATVSVNAACYVIGNTLPTITVTGSGFVPGDAVQLTDATGDLDGTATADADGDIDTTVSAPRYLFKKPTTYTDTITATDTTLVGTMVTATTTTLLAPLAVSAGKTHKEPGLKAFTLSTTWTFSGFTEGQTIYGHYLNGGKQVARQKFGTAVGPCGMLTVKDKLYPAKPTKRSYKVQFDTSKAYSRKTSPALKSKLTLSSL